MALDFDVIGFTFSIFSTFFVTFETFAGVLIFGIVGFLIVSYERTLDYDLVFLLFVPVL